MSKVGPRFTEAARAAAAAKRREKAGLAAQNFNEPSVFVVRSAEVGKQYGWEIRMYGGLRLEAAQDTFEAPGDARAAGLTELERLKKAGRFQNIGRAAKMSPRPLRVAVGSVAVEGSAA